MRLWLGALCREWLLPSQEVQQRHRRIQINPLGSSVMSRLCVPPFVKGTTINFMVRLDAKHYRNADADTLEWLMY